MIPTQDVLVEATSIGLITLDDAKILLGISASDVSLDPQLQMLIDQNSAIIADMCNRVLAKETLIETWECVAPLCCPDASAHIWLTHYPVAADGITQVESPAGTILDPSSYKLERRTGKLRLYPGTFGSEIVVTYTGGYSLPEEAPLPLQSAAGMLLRKTQSEAAQEATSGSGIKMISHKESRVLYFSPKDLAGTGTTNGGATVSTTQQRLADLLQKYTRIWI